MLRFVYENSPMHTFLYGSTVSGKIYLVRKYQQLYADQTPTERLTAYMYRESNYFIKDEDKPKEIKHNKPPKDKPIREVIERIYDI